MKGTSLPIARLERDVRERLFAPASGSLEQGRPLIGAEVELLALDADTRLPASIDGAAEPGRGTLEVVRGLAEALGWREERSESRPPRFRGPSGDALSWEPGGQLELSTRTHTSLSALARDVEAICSALRRRASDAGIELVAAGLDPWNALTDTPLRLRTPRYRAMTAYFRSLGPAGETMMRQTAALQVNLDFAADHERQWRVLHAAAPYFAAIFANSPRHAGEETGDRSHRATLWRELDRSRTGLLGLDGDVAREYLEFALDAGVMSRTDVEGRYLTMREWLLRGDVDDEEWRVHLTTLFPEVRPRGFLELRSCDAIAPADVIAPLVLAAGLALHPPTTRAAADLLGAPDAALLARAGHCGLRDGSVACIANDLATLALRGCEALRPARLDPEDLERARDWFGRYTRACRSPADDASQPEHVAAADLAI